ncbi:hypothetical protein GIB67_000964 [Kingdonia uniflora]|uniref:Uncharacterized protein n=1 Tax=Kingdonia uniflora TaxID=39325 RepID=A0A7J7MFS7_9MAGN|nr:hypothetical protein GIB67_000964 [Kingdonia uniflora]
MTSIKPSSRYPSFDSRVPDPSSSSEITKPRKNNQSTLKRLIGSSTIRRKSPDPIVPPVENSARALVKAKLVKNEQSLSSMVKKFVDIRSKPKGGGDGLLIPQDLIAEDMKKMAAKGSTFTSFQRKLFHKGYSGMERKEVKALTEVKSNTRTLAMVLRSERELLNENKEYEMEIVELKLTVEEKSIEVEKLRDLCLKQREEIKALKNAILFPDVTSSHLQEIFEKRGSELKHSKEVIPSLQRQVTSLTGQLQCLADEIEEVFSLTFAFIIAFHRLGWTLNNLHKQVKADKYAARACFEGHVNSPRTPACNDEATNSVEYNSGYSTAPGSPDNMFLKDFNPCLTPYAKSKVEDLFGSHTQKHNNNILESGGAKMHKSSEYCQIPTSGSPTSRITRRSNESRCAYGMQMHNKLF